MYAIHTQYVYHVNVYSIVAEKLCRTRDFRVGGKSAVRGIGVGAAMALLGCMLDFYKRHYPLAACRYSSACRHVTNTCP